MVNNARIKVFHVFCRGLIRSHFLAPNRLIFESLLESFWSKFCLKTMISEVLIFDEFLEGFLNRIFDEKGRLSGPEGRHRSPRRGGGEVNLSPKAF